MKQDRENAPHGLFTAREHWRSQPDRPSLAEAFRTMDLPQGPGKYKLLRRLLAFSGPGFLVAVGYMDPGNWATDLAAGSSFGYQLLAVVLLSSLMAMVLQSLSAKLGIATGRDLAQACRDHFGRRANFALWVLAEIGIVACDLAEMLGTALGLKLLFGIPLLLGVCLTVADVLIILALQRVGFRWIEAFVISLIGLVAGCFLVQLILARPIIGAIGQGFLDSPQILGDPAMLYLAAGILGATIMPHNLYLHSSIIQTRRYDLTPAGRKEAVKLATINSIFALTLAMLINGAILILAAAAFHSQGMTEVAEIADAHRLLTPLLGGGAAVLFALALLASGQNSAITATLAGQIVMEGFIAIRLRPWARRLVTRALAAGPALAVVAVAGEQGLGQLLILSQVILSIQLPFAVIPLVMFTSNKARMGEFASPRWLSVLAWVIAAVIVALNVNLLMQVALA